MKRTADGLFAMECRVAEMGGEWPADGPAHVPQAWLRASPDVGAAYGRRLAGEGRFGEARAALALAVRGFARQGAAEALCAALASLACVELAVGEVEMAETALRFLLDEKRGKAAAADGSAADGAPGGLHASVEGAEASYALGLGGYLAGLTQRERLNALAEAALGFAEANRPARALEALFERRRLAAAAAVTAAAPAEAGEPWSGLRLRFRQKAAWNGEFAWHAALLDGEANWEDAPLGGYGRMMARAEALRGALLREGTVAAAAQAKTLGEEMRQAFPGAVGMQAERLLLAAAARAAERDASGAAAALRELEALFALGLAPEYRALAGAVAAKVQAAAARTQAAPGAAAFGKAADRAAGAPLCVRCFGGLRLERKGAALPAPRWKRKKAQELFLLLLFRPGYAIPKEQAVDILYGDADPAKAANHLYVAIYEINRALRESCGAPESAALRDGVVALLDDVVEEVDVEKYETLIRVADHLYSAQPELSVELYEKAAELYGELLPNRPYVEWLSRLRDELEIKQFRALERLAESARKRGEAEREGRFLRERVELAPLQEDAVQALLRYYVREGRNADAVRLYETFERRLAAEFGCAPLPETERIVRGL